MRIVIIGASTKMHSRQDEGPAPADRFQSGDPALPRPWPLPAGTPLSTDVLLAGRNAVTIVHLGVHYVLRATRSGKLILTK
ncbi:hemin uptake protein HemP [Thauera sp. Sel9]|uniref:hemin uptake protein HemP n=1 Tax=Thauera sp. Sel9 TaxID=2974299 RepID=UPI0021E17205|nr:hemin uptake protein HemP [Thauera sp. Sel9]MCV2217366.1 hemin uptake protein HemP [Thauera sp. Sel9]